MWTEDAGNRFLAQSFYGALDLVQLLQVHRILTSAVTDLDRRRRVGADEEAAAELRDELFVECLELYGHMIYRASLHSDSSEFIRSTSQIMGRSPRIARILSRKDLQPCSYRSSQQGLSCWELLTYIALSRLRS